LRCIHEIKFDGYLVRIRKRSEDIEHGSPLQSPDEELLRREGENHILEIADRDRPTTLRMNADTAFAVGARQWGGVGIVPGHSRKERYHLPRLVLDTGIILSGR
jgi:hypothetical protein